MGVIRSYDVRFWCCEAGVRKPSAQDTFKVKIVVLLKEFKGLFIECHHDDTIIFLATRHATNIPYTCHKFGHTQKCLNLPPDVVAQPHNKGYIWVNANMRWCHHYGVMWRAAKGLVKMRKFTLLNSHYLHSFPGVIEHSSHILCGGENSPFLFRLTPWPWFGNNPRAPCQHG